MTATLCAALLLAAMPAQAATQADSFQVSALVVASCALSPLPAAAAKLPAAMPCQAAPALSPILAPPPRVILQRDEASGRAVLMMEF